jgi:hypothetical protein
MAKMQPFWWFIAPEVVNLIVNGGFETGNFTGWEEYYQVYVLSDEPYEGIYYCCWLTADRHILQVIKNVAGEDEPVDTNIILQFGFYGKTEYATGYFYVILNYTNYGSQQLAFKLTGTYQYYDLKPYLKLNDHLRYIEFDGRAASGVVHLDKVELWVPKT